MYILYAFLGEIVQQNYICMEKRAALIWFRNDLRLHDNEVFLEASSKSTFIIPVFCFDPRYYAKNQYDFLNTNVIRAAFQLETVKALKEKLQSLGSDLITFVGYPEDIIPRIAQKYEVDEVYHHREVAHRETTISEKVEEELWKSRINLKHIIGHTLYHKEDLPFPIRDIPNSFATFKKKIERESFVRNTADYPTNFMTAPHLEKTALPTLEELGYSPEEIVLVNNKLIEGGEDLGLETMQMILDDPRGSEHDYTLLSPFIALGSLSPIKLYHEIKKRENGKKSKRFDKIIDMLLWRDYFRFMLKKYPNVFFKEKGFKKEQIMSKNDQLLFDKWRFGETENEFVNQSMQLLQKTGYLPYFARIIVSSYLVQEYNINWLKGAYWFEQNIFDYSPATNYGNWSHIAGVGTSEKDNMPIDWQKLINTHYPKGIQVPEDYLGQIN